MNAPAADLALAAELTRLTAARDALAAENARLREAAEALAPELALLLTSYEGMACYVIGRTVDAPDDKEAWEVMEGCRGYLECTSEAFDALRAALAARALVEPPR